nr:MAG TPA: hypothetical protein [Caudoviricetes sp.]
MRVETGPDFPVPPMPRSVLPHGAGRFCRSGCSSIARSVLV